MIILPCYFCRQRLAKAFTCNLNLTSQQINRINKARMSGHGVGIKFSKTQLKKQGGFFSDLLNLGKLVLPFLAKKVILTLRLAAASGTKL